MNTFLSPIRSQTLDGGLVLLTRDSTEHEVDQERINMLRDSLTPVLHQMRALMDSTGLTSSVDTNQLLSFAVNQLAFTEAEVYTKQFRRRAYRDVLDIKADGGMWANEIRYETQGRKGKAKRFNPNSGDIPTADTEYGDRSVPVENGAIGYRYNIQELAASIQLGRSLATDKADAAREAFEDHMNEVSMLGESPFPSFFSFSGVTVSTITGNGWDNAMSGSAIFQQLDAEIIAYVVSNGENTFPNRLAMDITRLGKLSRPMSDSNPHGDTILQYFLKNNFSKVNGVDLQIVSVPEAAGRGAGGKDRAVLYNKNPRSARFQIPVPLMFLAPQLKGLQVIVPGFYRYGGVEFTRVKEVRYIDFPAYSA
jgi:hypothetical protein